MTSSYHEPVDHYERVTPIEAALLSKTSCALGYEPLRWGEKYENAHEQSPIAMATPIAIQFLNWTDAERNFVYGDDKKLGSTSTQRRNYIEAKNWRPWRTLSRMDMDFALSLIWLPEEPRSALEALAALGD